MKEILKNPHVKKVASKVFPVLDSPVRRGDKYAKKNELSSIKEGFHLIELSPHVRNIDDVTGQELPKLRLFDEHRLLLTFEASSAKEGENIRKARGEERGRVYIKRKDSEILTQLEDVWGGGHEGERVYQFPTRRLRLRRSITHPETSSVEYFLLINSEKSAEFPEYTTFDEGKIKRT